VVGICLHRFLFDSVPTEPHDQFVDWVITEKETVACRAL
jgi:5-formyltetrahydrofolate cyclo-ligase